MAPHECCCPQQRRHRNTLIPHPFGNGSALGGAPETKYFFTAYEREHWPVLPSQTWLLLPGAVLHFLLLPQ